MYKIVKKQSLIVKIISALIILYFITTALKLIFRQPEMTINDDLMRAASEINKHTPIIVDSMTRLDNVLALTGNKLQYTYTITKAEKDNLDTTILLANTKQNMINMIKTNPKSAYFRDNKVDILVNYLDKNEAYVCKLNISHNDY